MEWHKKNEWTNKRTKSDGTYKTNIELERVKAKQRRLESNFVLAFTMAWNGAHQQFHGANLEKQWKQINKKA